MRKVVIAICVLALAISLTGCGSFNKVTQPFQDAPRSGTNNGPAEIVTMPDGFNNAAAKCDGPNMVYTIYHGDSTYGAIAVAPNDPRCKR